MTDAELLAALSPLHTIAATLWGEARNQPPLGRVGIANVIDNRVRAQRPHWGLTHKAVCLKALQFSCWTPSGGLGNAGATMAAAHSFHREDYASRVAVHCVAIAAEVIARTLDDITGNATHYMTRHLFESDAPPAWAVGKMPCADIGDHVFFRLSA